MIPLDFDQQPLIATVMKLGAEADFILDASSSVAFKVNQGALESHKVSSTRVLGVRLLHKGCVGIAYSESFDPTALQLMLEQAVNNAQISKIDEHQSLSHSDTWAQHFQPDEFYTTELVSNGAMLDQLKALEARILEAPKISSCPYNGVTSSSYGRRIFSTAGLDVRTIESKASAYAYALAEFEGANAMVGTGQVARQFGDLDLAILAAEVQTKTIEMLTGKPITTGHYDVIFSNECLANIMNIFSQAFSGKSALDGITIWRDKLGSHVSKSDLTMIDRPRLTGFGACHFDGEGHAVQDTVIIDKGVLKTFLHNTTTARAFGSVSTGHAQRGPKSTLSVSHHQLNIAPGSVDAPTLRAGTYLEVTELTGLHSGANSITGDFSFGAAGFLCREGIRQQAVRGITIAGNFFECLNTLVIDSEQQWNWQKTMLLPGVRFQGLAISGG